MANGAGTVQSGSCTRSATTLSWYYLDSAYLQTQQVKIWRRNMATTNLLCLPNHRPVILHQCATLENWSLTCLLCMYVYCQVHPRCWGDYPTLLWRTHAPSTISPYLVEVGVGSPGFWSSPFRFLRIHECFQEHFSGLNLKARLSWRRALLSQSSDISI